MKKKISQIIFVLISAGILGWLFSGIYTGVTKGYFYVYIIILALLIVGWITIARIAEKKFGVSSMATKFIDYLFIIVIIVSTLVLFAYIRPVL